jgi:hypothetical protein
MSNVSHCGRLQALVLDLALDLTLVLELVPRHQLTLV